MGRADRSRDPALEEELPAEGHLFRDVSIAGVAIAVFFRNAAFARFTIDGARWSKTAAFVDRVLALPSFQKLCPFEDRCVRTPIARTVLAELGAPLLAETYGTTSPRRGMMRI